MASTISALESNRQLHTRCFGVAALRKQTDRTRSLVAWLSRARPFAGGQRRLNLRFHPGSSSRLQSDGG